MSAARPSGSGPIGAGDRLLVVIVNYRSAGLTADCLRSLAPEVAANPGTRAVVVENASGEEAALRAAIVEVGGGDWASLVVAGENAGFAAGNNVAIGPALGRECPPRYVLLLNPDTIVRPGAIGALLEFMDAHPDVGIAGSRLEGLDGRAQRSAFRFPSVLGELEGGLRLGLATRLLRRWVVAPPVPEDEGPTDWVSGASMIVRREVFEAIGLLDGGYFMYYEEVDFCGRAIAAGWPCWYVPSSRVVHLVGQSSGVTDAVSQKRPRPAYWFASRRRYFRAHLGAFGTTLADLAWSSAFASYRLRCLVQRKPDTDPPRLLRDFLRHNFLSTRAARP